MHRAWLEVTSCNVSNFRPAQHLKKSDGWCLVSGERSDSNKKLINMDLSVDRALAEFAKGQMTVS